MSYLFVSYERIAETLLSSDLTEVSRMRTPSVPVRAAVFSFGILLGYLDREKYAVNDFKMAAAKEWWPQLGMSLSLSLSLSLDSCTCTILLLLLFN